MDEKYLMYFRATEREFSFINIFNMYSDKYRIASLTKENFRKYCKFTVNDIEYDFYHDIKSLYVERTGYELYYVDIIKDGYEFRCFLPDFVISDKEENFIGCVDLKTIDSYLMKKQFIEYHNIGHIEYDKIKDTNYYKHDYARYNKEYGYDDVLAVQQSALAHYVLIAEKYKIPVYIMFEGIKFYSGSPDVYAYFNSINLYNELIKSGNKSLAYKYTSCGYSESSFLIPFRDNQRFHPIDITYQNSIKDEFFDTMCDNMKKP